MIVSYRTLSISLVWRVLETCHVLTPTYFVLYIACCTQTCVVVTADAHACLGQYIFLRAAINLTRFVFLAGKSKKQDRQVGRCTGERWVL